MNPVLCETCSRSAGNLDFFCTGCGAVLPREHVTFTCQSGGDGLFPSVSWQAREATNPDPLDPGSQVGQFQILKKLAHGGMGVVYQAKDLALDRTLAVKVLRTGSGSHEANRHFLLEEARKASRLNHPNIVRIFNVARGDGLGFMAMELVQGSRLQSLVPAGGLPRERVIHLMSQAGGGPATCPRQRHRSRGPETRQLNGHGR